MDDGIADLQDINESEFLRHVADGHVVPVFRRIQLRKVIGLQKRVCQQRAAEREPFAANAILAI